jgi:hypothetical protein
MADRRFPPPRSVGVTAQERSVVAGARSSGFFQFPVVAHASKNCGKRDDDQSDHAQAKSDSEE